MVLPLALASALALADAATGMPVFVEDAAILDPHDTGRERFVSLGVVVAPGGNWFGLRGQLDAITVGGWSFGTAATVFGRGDDPIGDDKLKLTGVAYLAYTARLAGRLGLRVQAGYGGELTVFADATTRMATTSTFRVVEAAALVTVRGNHDWSAVAGPIVDAPVSGMGEGTTTMVVFGLERRF
jgi:hypothetical protein|nr:hypothetical protein [Kofleriaceae bacterium]